MEGTLRIHVERKKTGATLTRPGSANVVNNSTSISSSLNLQQQHQLHNTKIPHHLRDTLAEKYDLQRKISSYVGGKVMNIATKVLPVCDFDAGSVVFLREGCFDIDKDIMLVVEDSDNPAPPFATNTTSSSAMGAGLGTTTDTPDVFTGTTAQPPSSSFRRKKPPPPLLTGAYELIFDFVVPTTMIVMPRLRLESAIAVTKEEVKNRQSTADIEGIVKWVYRAETMVIDRISSLSSWLQGGGVTVDRKKTHVVTLREIAHRKHWCFDGFVGEEKKIELKDIVEKEERDRYEQMLRTEKLRLDMQSALMTNPNAGGNRTGGGRDVALVPAAGLEQVTYLTYLL